MITFFQKIKIHIATLLIAFAVVLVPMITFAQGVTTRTTTTTTTATTATNSCASNFNTIGDFFIYGTCILNKTVVPLLMTVALIMFFVGMIRFIASAGDETKRKEGKQFMLWGIIGLFVMLTIFGILGVLVNTFGITGFAIPQFGNS